MNKAEILTEMKKNKPKSPKSKSDFFKNPCLGLNLQNEYSCLNFKRIESQQIDRDEIKMVRNLEKWDFVTKFKLKQPIAVYQTENVNTIGAKLLQKSESTASRKISEINIDLINSILRQSSGYFVSHPIEENKIQQNENQNSFEAAKACSHNRGVQNNDHSRYLLYETLKNSVSRDCAITSETPDEMIHEKLKITAHKIVGNFEQLRETINEKSMQYSSIIQETIEKKEKMLKFEKAVHWAKLIGDHEIFQSRRESEKLKRAQELFDGIVRLLKHNDQISSEFFLIDNQMNSLKEELNRTEELVQDIENRPVI